MNVSLTPELEKLVQSKVESGLYNSASEVIRESLRLLHERDRVREIRLEELRKEIQKGFASGQALPLEDIDDIIKEASAEFESENSI